MVPVQKKNQKVSPSFLVDLGTELIQITKDFVTEYTAAAEEFAKKCLDPSFGPTKAITEFSKNMAISGYYSEPESLQARLHGTKVIEASLLLSLSDSEGVLDPQFAGDTMRINYHALNSRPSLIDQLTVTPIECPILVIHGSLDKAVCTARLDWEIAVADLFSTVST